MTDTTAQDIAFLQFLITSLVSQPDQVRVERTVDDLGVLISLQVARDDMGKIIGKDGQTAKAIRILLRVIGAKNDERVNLKILEPIEPLESVA